MKLELARISNNASTASFPIYDNSHFRCTLRTNINPYSVFDKEIWIPSQIFPSIWCITKCHTLWNMFGTFHQGVRCDQTSGMDQVTSLKRHETTRAGGSQRNKSIKTWPCVGKWPEMLPIWSDIIIWFKPRKREICRLTWPFQISKLARRRQCSNAQKWIEPSTCCRLYQICCGRR